MKSESENISQCSTFLHSLLLSCLHLRLIYWASIVEDMSKKLRFSDLVSSGEAKSMNTRYDTHIVSSDGNWDWKPLKVEVPATWQNLARRIRGEA